MHTFSCGIRRSVWLVYWVVVAVLTHLPPAKVPHPQVVLADKAAHFAIFFGLTLLGGWYRASRDPCRRPAAALWVLLTVYAILDELTQPLTGRTASFADLIADMLGLAAAMWLLSSRGTSRKTPQSKPSAP